MTPGYPGGATLWHEAGRDGWDGPTGFYSSDLREPPKDDKSKTFSDIYVWAHPAYPDETMWVSFQSDPILAPPTNRRYWLELVDVPEGIEWPQQTLWEVPVGENFTLALDAYTALEGRDGYRFSFTISPVVPEPGNLVLVASGAVLLLGGRRRRGREH